MPSENELAGRFGVNRHTVRRAVEDLIAAGLLERRHGVGTFVLDAPADYLLARGTRFTETFESLARPRAAASCASWSFRRAAALRAGSV